MELITTSVDWHNINRRILAGDTSAEEKLYEVLRRGMCYLIARSVEQEDVLDVFHNAFAALVKGIRKGKVKTPAALPGYARTIVVREVGAWINGRIAERHNSSIEDITLREHRSSMSPAYRFEVQEQSQAIRGLLDTLHRKHPLQVEILTRFYLKEESPETIIRELNLTADQFRNFKHRGLQFLSQQAGYAFAA